jgi:hypothetical protein
MIEHGIDLKNRLRYRLMVKVAINCLNGNLS